MVTKRKLSASSSRAEFLGRGWSCPPCLAPRLQARVAPGAGGAGEGRGRWGLGQRGEGRGRRRAGAGLRQPGPICCWPLEGRGLRAPGSLQEEAHRVPGPTASLGSPGVLSVRCVCAAPAAAAAPHSTRETPLHSGDSARWWLEPCKGKCDFLLCKLRSAPTVSEEPEVTRADAVS